MFESAAGENALPVAEVFNTLTSRSLCAGANSASPQAFKRLMQGLISRQPNNLKRHVQYIHGLIALAPGDADAIFSALLNLFVVLETSGFALRKRLLLLAKPHLLLAHYKFLGRHLVTGLSKDTILPAGYYAMLSAANSGRFDFIKKQPQHRAGFASAYEEALSLLEYGQLTEAQHLLEQALKEQPDNPRIAEELVAVYQHHNDAQATEKMSQWFIRNNIGLPECWPLM